MHVNRSQRHTVKLHLQTTCNHVSYITWKHYVCTYVRHNIICMLNWHYYCDGLTYGSLPLSCFYTLFGTSPSQAKLMKDYLYNYMLVVVMLKNHSYNSQSGLHV